MSTKDQIHILVVDDMSTSRGLIIQALESMGIANVHHAADGGAALTTMASRPVHLVLSDFNMPGMDGLTLLKEIRTNPKTRGAGFILITGRADKEMIDSGRALGMNNFIKKPFTPVELRACLEAVVGRL
ncbi:response regulator [Paracoccus suum]|uniref:Response regulator n=1 Tax=Paracoccus suum TaxID=2259340 RepID=A0A344PMV2_9RHOB|nr:response regulator [Paracoccus suum]AXC50707.1 response regulator [Paracoccus suum]